MEENLQNFQEQEQNTSHNKKHPIILYIILLVVIIGVAFFLYEGYLNTGSLNSGFKKTFTKEEKLEILDSLSSDSEDIPSIEERREILNNVTQSRSNDLYNYSEEGKLQILRSLQE
ncbi:MAG: hypothetical protein QGH85_02075 [Candidatus Pacebacteria bacterium]|jgi:hypothetical protein|nr:hypothetical protein [Candidatus Paceibacterota bacterium]MDP7366383.1 hypothetical protein [Candidatus Paceibacterota bacterium]MDP7466387.1 hypothetical protein [Candidatus Paceibacterota bacterium]MDP7648100.1 hypothetical protein [Candidatus Paceibacterota bacterium]|tara:strand:- start:7440 stop:7787 length:348 start_codon:yes stop_codon:yes gene_type:complete